MKLSLLPHAEKRPHYIVRQFFVDSYIDFAITFFLLVTLVLKHPWTMQFVASFMLACVSFGLWIWARVELGEYHTLAPQPLALITTGLYRHVRHPMYLFSAFTYIFIVIAVGTWVLLVVFLPIIYFQRVRAKEEERQMLLAYGEVYQSYRAKTWF